MDLQLSGKRALVTGSTAGIGLAIVELLAAEGATVIINGRTRQRVDAALSQLRDKSPAGKLEGLVADLGSEDGVKRAIEKFPHVDILVNNLGIFEPKPFPEIPDSDWFRFFEVNVMSGVRLSRHYLPRMLEKNWGRIVFVSSESGLQIPKEMIHYGMTKTAQLAIARGLAETTIGTAVTVNSVLPGPTESEGVSAFVGQMAAAANTNREQVERDFFKTARPSSLLQRFERTDEIAALVAFVVSPRASGINGASLRVDGGVVKTMA
jgi:NAD(P)-dependent dehydrogenase (short-subunit alcohol dehydrogenase family)